MKYSIVVFFVVLLSISCAKIKERTVLQDVWKLDDDAQSTVPVYYEVWDFRKDHILVIYQRSYEDPSYRLLIGKGPYKLKKRLFDEEYILRIDSIGMVYDGNWKVLSLKKDRFSMVLDEPPIWKYRSFSKY